VFLAKLLGVTINSTLNFSEHVAQIVSQCNQRSFLLRTLRRRCMRSSVLEAVFTALIVSLILYAISAWGGFVSSTDIRRIDSLFLNVGNLVIVRKPQLLNICYLDLIKDFLGRYKIKTIVSTIYYLLFVLPLLSCVTEDILSLYLTALLTSLNARLSRECYSLKFDVALVVLCV